MPTWADIGDQLREFNREPTTCTYVTLGNGVPPGPEGPRFPRYGLLNRGSRTNPERDVEAMTAAAHHPAATRRTAATTAARTTDAVTETTAQ